MENTLPIDGLNLECFTESLENNGLMDGKTGTALFLLILAESQNKPEHGERAVEILHEAFEDAIEYDGPLNFSFGYGITGLAYVVNKFKSNPAVRASIDDTFLPALDGLILDGIAVQLDSQNLGFMNGVAGNLYYLVNRSLDMAEYRSAVADIVAKLYINAIKDSDGTRFDAGKLHADLKMTGFEKHFNLSLSDGLTGILSVLLHIYSIYPEMQHLRELIEGGIKFILGLERGVCIAEKRICFYPTVVSREREKRNEKTEFYNSRLGWCIGDLTVSLLLCRAGKLFKKQDWLHKGNSIAEFTLERKTAELTKIDNAALCHGASGVAAVYKYLSELTGNPLLGEGYDFWIGKALSNEYEHNKSNGDLLNGSVGISLAKAERCGMISHDSWGDIFLL